VTRAARAPGSVAAMIRFGGTTVAVALTLLLSLTLAPTGSASAAGPAGPADAAGSAAAPANTASPRVAGEPIFGALLTASRGTWQGEGLTFAFQWFREDQRIRGADAARYRPVRADLRHRLRVRVTAADAAGARAVADSAFTSRVRAATMVSRERPRLRGVRRFGHTLRATTGTWSPRPTKVRYQWLRGDRPIRRATGARYRLRPVDVGRRISVQVRATAVGHTWGVRRSRPATVRHRVDVRRTVSYRVVTRGRVRADVGRFKALAAQTYADARGWRGAGVRFRQVARGGSFTLVLANAGAMTSFSSGCSPMWSCRVGRYVIINQERWLRASPAWNRAGRSLRDYRHMVVNHETGHWLGLGHRSCPGAGQPAPVMMQQSKGRAGCRFNPWPTAPERRAAR
jgi:hypothetical protein